MKLNLANQRVVVLGAARGIGRAIADSFSDEGCRVCFADRSPVEEDSIFSAACDIADPDSVSQLAARLEGEWGGVDHVVCAAAIGSGKFGFPFWNLEPGDWKPVLEVTLVGSVNVAHGFAPRMKEEGDGKRKSFLFLTSVAGQIGSQTDPPYSAAKAGVINFTQCAAKDLAPFGIRVNAISPGMVRTELNESVWAAGQESLPESERQTYDEWAGEKIRGISPMGRWQSVEEFGAMAVFLASDHARNITGQTINIDGGQVMHS